MVSFAGRWVFLNDLKYGTSKMLETKTIVKNTKEGPVPVVMYRISSLADMIMGFGWRVIFACFPGHVKISGRLRVVKLFIGFVYRMYKNHGEVITVKYLKAAQLALQKAVAKDAIDSLSDLEPDLFHTKLTGFKMPRIIPSRDRKLINGGSTSILRFWLTLFAVYRVISIPGKLKLNTIFDSSSISVDSLKTVNSRFLGFLIQSSAKSLFSLKRLRRPVDLLLLETASSTTKVSWMGMFSDPHLLLAYGSQYAYIKNLMVKCGQDELVLFYDTLIALGKSKDKPEPQIQTEVDNIYKGAKIMDPSGNFLGKLSIKSEAAGKERVFAMVDFWTQQALKPIHDMLFKTLKALPNDGTFDQTASVKRAAAKSQIYNQSFGYDLSAATDRLPILLQMSLLDYLLPGLGTNWSRALTQRGYYLILPDYLSKEHGIPVTAKEKAAFAADSKVVPNSITINGKEFEVIYTPKGKPFIVLTYSVGQPMGALSSWAMLAITHHFLVQLAYREAYEVPFNVPFTKDTWYTGYELLGDDIILFDSKVAKAYLRVMDEIGVPINTSKSVCARVPVTEFAKVTTLNGTDVSAVSWKMFMSGNSLMGRANIAFYLLNKGIVLKGINPWISRFAQQTLHRAGNSLPTFIALWTMLSNRNVITVEQALGALIDGTQKVFRLGKAILMNADANKIKLALPGLILGLGRTLTESRRAKLIWNIEKTWFGIHMWKPLAVFNAKTDVQTDVMVLTKAMLKLACSYADLSKLPDNPLEMDHGTFFVDGAPTLNGVGADIEKNDQIVLFGALYTFVLKRAERLVEPIVVKPAQIDSPLPELVEGRDILDRYNELLELVKRAKIKLDPDSEVIPPRAVKPTELKLIKLLRKMGNRPLFTTAHSLF